VRWRNPQQEPDNPEALNFIGYSWADRGIKLDEAEAMIKKALSLKPAMGSSPTPRLGLLPEEPDRRGHQVPEGSSIHPAGRRGHCRSPGRCLREGRKTKDAWNSIRRL